MHLLALASVVTLNLALLAKIVGVVLPLLVALITKEKAPAWLKAVLLAFLSAIAGVVTTAINNGGTVVLKAAFDAGVTAWITGIAAYYGLWKPSGVAPALAASTPNLGLGSNVESPLPVEVSDPPKSEVARVAARRGRAKPVGRDSGRQAPK